MTLPLSYASGDAASRRPRGGLGTVSCGLAVVGWLLLAYALLRLFRDSSPIYFGVSLLALAPAALGVVTGGAGMLWRSRRRHALLGVVLNLLLGAGLLAMFLFGPGPG